MARSDARGRKDSPRHIRIDHWMLKTDAWRSLNPREIAIFLILLERFYGTNNGYISLSVREAARLGHMSQNTAAKSLKTLAERGFIKVRRKGSFSQKLKLASEFELTHLPYGHNRPSKEFASWRKEITLPKKVHNSVTLGAMSNNNVI